MRSNLHIQFLHKKRDFLKNVQCIICDINILNYLLLKYKNATELIQLEPRLTYDTYNFKIKFLRKIN